MTSILLVLVALKMIKDGFECLWRFLAAVVGVAMSMAATQVAHDD